MNPLVLVTIEYHRKIFILERAAVYICIYVFFSYMVQLDHCLRLGEGCRLTTSLTLQNSIRACPMS